MWIVMFGLLYLNIIFSLSKEKVTMSENKSMSFFYQKANPDLIYWLLFIIFNVALLVFSHSAICIYVKHFVLISAR